MKKKILWVSIFMAFIPYIWANTSIFSISSNSDSDVFFSSGFENYFQGRFDLAEADFNIAIKLAPGDILSYHYRAKAKSKRENWRGALTDLNYALILHADHVDSLILRSQIRSQVGEFSGAMNDIEKAIQHRPKESQCWLTRGHIKMALDHPKEAVQDFQKALSLSPLDPEILRQLAWTHATHLDPEIRNPEKAMQLALQARELKKSPEILDTLALTYAELGQFEAAIQIQSNACLQSSNLAFLDRLMHYEAHQSYTQVQKETVLKEEIEAQEKARRAQIWDEIVQKNEVIREQENAEHEKWVNWLKKKWTQKKQTEKDLQSEEPSLGRSDEPVTPTQMESEKQPLSEKKTPTQRFQSLPLAQKT